MYFENLNLSYILISDLSTGCIIFRSFIVFLSLSLPDAAKKFKIAFFVFLFCVRRLCKKKLSQRRTLF